MPNPHTLRAVETQPARRLGRFRCEQKLGGDDLLETWRARVQGLAGLDRSFAVKFLRPEIAAAQPAVVARFLGAGRRASVLQDERIGRVVETGTAEATAFVATEFAQGIDVGALRDRAHEVAGANARTKWVRLAAFVGAEAARGLAVAHGAETQIVHGALVPGNVLLTTRGKVKLLDFGLRVAVANATSQATSAYHAPELAGGAAHGTAADVFALGVVVLELASKGDLLGQDAYRRALADLPATLAAALESMTAADPASRPDATRAAEMLRSTVVGADEELVRELGAVISQLTTRHEASMEAILPTAPIDDEPTAEHALKVSNSLLQSLPTATNPRKDLAALVAQTRRSSVQAVPVMPSVEPLFEAVAEPVAEAVVEAELSQVASTSTHGAVAEFEEAWAMPLQEAPGTEAPRTERRAPTAAASPPALPERRAQGHAVAPEAVPLPAPAEMDASAELITDRDVMEAGAPRRSTIPPPPPPGRRTMSAARGSAARKVEHDPSVDGVLEEEPLDDLEQVPVSGGTSRKKLLLIVGGCVLGSALVFGAGGFFAGQQFAPVPPPPPLVTKTQPAPKPASPLAPSATAPVPNQASAQPTLETKTAPPATTATTPNKIASPAAQKASAPTVADKTAPATVAGNAAPVAATEKAPPATTVEKAPVTTVEKTAAPAPITQTSPVEVEPEPTGPGTVRVSIASTPPGAAVWIDGKLRGRTPLATRVAGHAPVRLALIRTGHRILKTTLDPSKNAQLDERLEPIPAATRGETGVRVDCNTPATYPVLADDQETGLLCPTGRITLSPGPHKVSLYVPAIDQVISKDVMVEDMGIKSVKIRK